jgi:Icc-related predicted phosphoesterase
MIKGDVLLHCGDLTSIWKRDKHEFDQLQELNEWFGSLNFNKIICIAGNHDRLLQDIPESRKVFTNAVYLQDEAYEYEGVKFYGTPWQLTCGNLAFNAFERSLETVWDKIPDDTDVLLTHSPPYSILDKTVHGDLIGSKTLLVRVGQVQPKIHCFGHCHAGNGNLKEDKIHYINAASAVSYKAFAEPFVVKI